MHPNSKTMNIHRHMEQTCATQHELRYALQQSSGRMVFVDDVPTGKKCGCVCPECKQPLIARNSKWGEAQKREHHFAHHGNLSCSGARMTALHLLAQQILERDKTVMLPDYEEEFFRKELNRVITFDEVILEKRIQAPDGHLIVDCVGIKGAHELLIEILVTHQVDENKQKKIQSIGKACIEIDLSDLLLEEYTEDIVANSLKERKFDRKWISCPQWDKENESRKIYYLKWEKEIDLRETTRVQDDAFLENPCEEERININDYVLKKKIEVQRWFSTGDNLIAEGFLLDLKSQYRTQLYKILIPDNNFKEYIKRAPKSIEGLNLFFAILRLNYQRVTQADEACIINRFRYWTDNNIDNNTILRTKVEIDEYISLFVVYTLQNGIKTNINSNDLRNRFLNDIEFRRKALSLLYVYYSYSADRTSILYKKCIEDVIEQFPNLAELCLAIINKNSLFEKSSDTQVQEYVNKLKMLQLKYDLILEKDLCNLLRTVYGIYIIENNKPSRDYFTKYKLTQSEINQIKKRLG